jgi:hypothetical protein
MFTVQLARSGTAAVIYRNRTLRGVIITVLVIGVSYFTYKVKYPDYTFRYRLELTLEIDGIPYTGSSVIEVQWIGGPSIEHHGANAADGFVYGQAPLIDLGQRGVLIAALETDLGNDAAVSARWLGAQAFGNDSSYDRLPELARVRGRRDLKPDNWPRLMLLPDRLDPKSARKIGPDEIENIFGHGARFTSAFVETTHDSIKIDIDKKLPWYPAWADEIRKVRLQLSYPGVVTLRPLMLVGGA